jgi:hemerythrin-like metal-binding protein
MALAGWRKKYSVGVKVLDDQHRTILRILNELHAAAIKGKIGEVAGPLLSQALCASREHFSTEEELMELTAYPGLAEHRCRHAELTARVAEFLSCPSEPNLKSYVELLHFVRDWFRGHILGSDQKYTLWMNQHGVR